MIGAKGRTAIEGVGDFMGTYIIKGKLYIDVKEVMTLMKDMRDNMQNRKDSLISDMQKTSAPQPVKDACIRFVEDDFCYIIETIDLNVLSYKKMCEEGLKRLMNK